MTGLDIKIARIRAGLRQYKVAAALGITQTVLSQIENEQRNVSQEQLEQITRAIRVLAARSESEVPDAA
jgi:transcriptional regulator with XRE-family HTH domain